MSHPCDDCRWNDGGRNSGCDKGYVMDEPDCPEEERDPYRESYPSRFGMSEAEVWEYADWKGDMMREGATDDDNRGHKAAGQQFGL